MVCKQCGSECTEEALFCGNCGASLLEGTVTEAGAEQSGKAGKSKNKEKRQIRTPRLLISIGAAVLVLAVVLYLILRGTPAEAIRLTNSEMTIKEGTTCQMTYRLTPADSDDELTWSSSDERVATVENGLLTAISEGDCVITVLTESGCKDVCYLRVKPPLSVQEKEATGYRRLYASTKDGKVTYHYGSDYTLSLYSDLTGHLYCPDGVWKLTWSYSHTEDSRYYFNAELADGTDATVIYDADTGHSMHGIVSILLKNGNLWTFK